MKKFFYAIIISFNLFAVVAQAADVEKSLPVIFGREGGLQCDKDDVGNYWIGKDGKKRFGCTKFGLSPKTTKKDNRNATIKEAAKYYEVNFWKPLNLDHLKSQGLATEILDTAVNCGDGTSAKMPNQAVEDVQKIVIGLQEYKPKQPVTTLNKDTVDWINGFTETEYYTSETETSITEEEYNKCEKDGFIYLPFFDSKTDKFEMHKETCIKDKSNRVLFWLTLNRLQSKRYIEIVQKNPKMQKYMLSWEKRTVD
jgi:hypothetical protein